MRMRNLTTGGLAVLLATSAAVHADEGAFDKQLSADPRGIVEISNFSGRVEVSGWDQSLVSVAASHVGNGSDKIDFRSDHGRTTITVKMPNFPFGMEGVDLRIRVPRGSEVDVTGVSSDVTSTGVTGAQRLKTVSGSIRAEIAQADVEAKTVSGDVILHGGGKSSDVHATSISGSIHLDHGAGDVEANTTSGELSLQLDPARSVRMRTISGDVLLRGKLTKDADVDTQTVSGDVRFHTGAENGFEYEVTTFSGDIDNCFNASAEKTNRHGPGERLSGALGNGAAHVRIKTMSGDINLCDKP